MPFIKINQSISESFLYYHSKFKIKSMQEACETQEKIKAQLPPISRRIIVFDLKTAELE